MVTTVKLDLGRHAAQMGGRAIVLNGHTVGHVSEDGCEVQVQPGFNIIALGHGVNQTNPVRFQGFDGDEVTIQVVWEDDVAIGGALGGRYSLHVVPAA